MVDKIISIIIPVYNVERYLEQCLQSIFSQGRFLDQIEVIIVNDGSPDNSHLIIEKYANKYLDIVRVVTQKNQGLSMARNNGLDVARGKYVWFVDSDDWLLDDSITIVLSEIKENPMVDVFASFLKQYYESDGSYHYSTYHGGLHFSGLSYLKKKLPSGASQRFVYKREFLDSNNLRFVPQILHEDAVWGFMMLYKAKHVKIIDKPIYVYRIRMSDSIMSSIKMRTAYDLIKGHKLTCEWMKKFVAIEDNKVFNYIIFGLIKTMLDFTKRLAATKEYKDFLQDNKTYIRKNALKAMAYKPLDISLLIIAIHPQLFAFLCKLLKK